MADVTISSLPLGTPTGSSIIPMVNNDVTQRTLVSSITANLTPVTSSGLAKAWVSFDATRNAAGVSGLANTPRYIYGSMNVANVTRTSPGNYFVNFATPFPAADYAFTTSAFHYGGNTIAIGTSLSDYAADRLGVICYIGWAHDAYYDSSVISVTIFR